MQPRDWFGLAVRIMALWFTIFAVYQAYYVVMKAVGLATQSKLPLTSHLAEMIFFLIVAAMTLFGAQRLVNLAYGPAKID